MLGGTGSGDMRAASSPEKKKKKKKAKKKTDEAPADVPLQPPRVLRRQTSRDGKRSHTTAAMGFLCAARRNSSSRRPSATQGGGRGDSDSDSYAVRDDEVAPQWMVDEAVRRSSQVPSAQSAKEVRETLSKFSVSALIGLMAPLDERESITADDFFDRKSNLSAVVEARSDEDADGDSELVCGAATVSRRSPSELERALHRRSSLAQQMGGGSQRLSSAAPVVAAPKRTSRRGKQRSKRAAAMASILCKPDGWDYSHKASSQARDGSPAGAALHQAPANRSLLSLTVDDVQQLLACWGLDCFAAQLGAEAADGNALNDIEDLDDLDDFSATNRRQRKKLVRLIR
jgi:hypothetical protein